MLGPTNRVKRTTETRDPEAEKSAGDKPGADQAKAPKTETEAPAAGEAEKPEEAVKTSEES